MKYLSICRVVFVTALVLLPVFGQQRTGQVLRYGSMTTEETNRLVELSNSATGGSDAPPRLWTSSTMASRDGRIYTGISIGSSPYADLKATKIPVVVVPLVVTVNGVTLDPTAAVTNSCVRPDWNGKTPVEVLLQSPIFTATDWIMNGANVGHTQYLDAFQRAQYWSTVRGSNYHTLLSPVTVAEAQVAPVSAIDSAASTASSACVSQAGGNPDQITLGRSATGLLTQWIEGTLIPTLQTQKVINSQELVYFLLYNTTFSDATGFHSYVGNQTYAVSFINGSDCCAPDIATASQVLGDWMNDPIPTERANSPGWFSPDDKVGRSRSCQEYSAVSSPTSDLMFPTVAMPNGVSYHLQELTFQSWFRGAPSTGAGGLFSNNSSLAVDAGAVCHVAASAVLTITTSSLNTAVAGMPYSQTLTATGGTAPYSWSVRGRLPAGLTLSPTGVISGTPLTTGGGSLLVFEVADSSNPEETATATLEFPYFLDIATGSLSNGAVGAMYFQSLLATGGTPPYTWQLTSGTLPPGLTLHPSSGSITGTPTSPVSATPLTFTVTDSSSPPQSTAATFTLTVTASTFSITTTALPNGVVGVPYAQTLAAAGGTTPYTWQLTAGTLPAGLNLNSATGAISGTPTSAVTATPLTFMVTDSSAVAQTASKSLTLAVITQLTTAPKVSLNCNVGSACSITLTATGGVTPYSWQLTSGTLPSGLKLNSATGVISGTATTALAATPFTFVVTDSGTPQQSATSTVTISVSNTVLQIQTTALAVGTTGAPYSQSLTAIGGTAPYAWSVKSGRLPGGITLNALTGLISGTASSPTSELLTFQVTDSSSPQQSATVLLLLTINSTP
jgi:hypothetical protein